MPRWPLSDRARFWSKVDASAGRYRCWLWRGSATARYGRFYRSGRAGYAHRLSYEWEHGAIPPGLSIDHLCRNTFCVNPAHLEAVTHRENMRRGIGPAAHALRHDECSRGHPLTEANTYRLPSKPTFRFCRQCRGINRRRYNARMEATHA